MTETIIRDRALVTARKVSGTSPIEGADNIELAHIDGWQVVVKKGDFWPGDVGIFFEIDSALPLDGAFAFLANRSPKKVIDGETHHVLRTAKLRGAISQGLLLTPEEIGLADNVEAGTDLTEWAETVHGVVKYDPPLPLSGGEICGNWPHDLARKTDSERIQNFSPELWSRIGALRDLWKATEKIDGTSSTFVQTREGLIVCSRNYQIKEGDNLYWGIVEKYGLREMPLGMVIQGEIFGQGIQGNKLDMDDKYLAVFNIDIQNMPAEYGEMPPIIGNLSFVPRWEDMKLGDTVEECIAQADGIKSLVNPERLAEGIVWTGPSMPGLDHRNTFKVISNKWLLKGGE